MEQIANIRVLNTVSDTSEVSERLFPGQFNRWTIQLEIQDAFLYDVPYRKNWKLYIDDTETLPEEECSTFEVGEDLLIRDLKNDEIEPLTFNFQK